MMSEFDVIVIGAGPAGSYAALTAARKGCSVAMFEEHAAVGWPRHDPGWLMETEFTKSLVTALEKTLPWIKIKEFRVSSGESGALIEASTQAGYLVRRDLLEKEMAGLAVKAGAKLYLRTKVVKLVKGQGGVEAVETNSAQLPTVKGKVIICADGIRSAGNGFAVKEGLCEGVVVRPGISYLLANADVTPGVVDQFLSSEALLNYRCFWTHGNGMCFVGFPSLKAFDELKQRTDNAVSRKIRNAYPVELSGFSRTSSGKYGQYFKSFARDNVLYVGDASGGAGCIHGMIQGQFAATVAASAIKDNDVSASRLSEYQERVLKTLGKAPFFYFSAREDFGTFENWFREVEAATKGIIATEVLATS